MRELTGVKPATPIPAVIDQQGIVLNDEGRPIPSSFIASLRGEAAPVDATLGRPPFSGHLAYGMDPYRLASILRANDNGSTLNWSILEEEIEEQYAHYYAVLSKRRRQVCQLPITIEAARNDKESMKHADFVRDWLKTDVLADGMFDMFDAIGKGFSMHEIEWDTQPGSVTPAQFIYRPKRFFELNWQDGDTIWLRSASGYENLAPHKWVQHRHKSKSGLIVRAGLTRVVCFLWMFSAFTLRDWALFCQAYGMPIRIGRYGPEASENDKRVLWRAVSSIAGDVSAIFPKSMEMEFIKDTDRAAGATLYEKRADWLDRTTSKVVLGGTAGTDAVNGGHATSREHRAAEQDVEKFDAQLLSITLTRQVVKQSVRFSYGEQQAYPRLIIGSPDQIPLQHFIAGVADLAGLGLTVKAQEVRDRLQLTKPEDGDEVIGGRAPVQDVTRPPVAPELNAMGQKLLSGLVTAHSEAPPELVEKLSDRLAEDAAGALAGMTEAVRAQFDEATDLHDLVERLHRLKLPQEEFAEAMSRGMALANLVGQATLAAKLHGRRAGS